MQKKLVNVYTLNVYSDGSVELIPVTEVTTSLSKCSSGIRQIVGIIDNVMVDLKAHPEKHIHYSVTASLNKIAAEECVTSSTVHSKILRKLNLSMEDFKGLLKKCLENRAPDEDELVKILRSVCQSRTKQADIDAVEDLIVRIRSW